MSQIVVRFSFTILRWIFKPKFWVPFFGSICWCFPVNVLSLIWMRSIFFSKQDALLSFFLFKEKNLFLIFEQKEMFSWKVCHVSRQTNLSFLNFGQALSFLKLCNFPSTRRLKCFHYCFAMIQNEDWVILFSFITF